MIHSLTHILDTTLTLKLILTCLVALGWLQLFLPQKLIHIYMNALKHKSLYFQLNTEDN